MWFSSKGEKLNIDTIKSKLLLLKNEKVKIKISLGRNKYEYYEGYIEKLHPNIFTIKTMQGIKSFSYSDILIKNLVITKFN